MNELRSADGKYLCIQQGDVIPEDPWGNFVVYGPDGKPCWDKRSFEAGPAPAAPPETVDSGNEPPEPAQPSPPALPPPAGGGGARLIQVTHDGQYVNRMYSYWANAWVSHNTITVFAGHVDGRPRFFQVQRLTGFVETMAWWCAYSGTTEGWYFDPHGWIYLIDGPRLRRITPSTGADEIVFSIEESHPGCVLHQAHSSDDGQTHSATVARIVSDGQYPRLGTVVFWHGRQDFFPAIGTLDESQITPDGMFLVIKETPDGEPVNNNDCRIINLYTRETRLIRDAERACGHSDLGPGYMIGEADKPDPGALVWWDLRKSLTIERCKILAPTLNLGYIAVRAGRWLWGSPTHLSLVSPDGAVTELLEHGGGSDDDSRIKANLSMPGGEVACFVKDGDVFLYVI